MPVRNLVRCKTHSILTSHAIIVLILLTFHAAIRLLARRTVGVARQFVQPHFSRTESKPVESNLLDTKQGG